MPFHDVLTLLLSDLLAQSHAYVLICHHLIADNVLSYTVQYGSHLLQLAVEDLKCGCFELRSCISVKSTLDFEEDTKK